MTPTPKGLARLRRIGLQEGYIYGPVRSRRLGLSLGVNPLPLSYKFCDFDCVYCQYGWTRMREEKGLPGREGLPSVPRVLEALESALRSLAQRGVRPDAITIAGNGEPTLHPGFPELVRGVCALRDRGAPEARVAVLSDSSTVDRPSVREALDLLDDRIMKLDAADPETLRDINSPLPSFHLEEVLEGLRLLRDVTLQALFVRGRVDNTRPEALGPWLAAIRSVRPLLTQVYSLDRAPVDPQVLPVGRPILRRIARRVREEAGVPAEVY